MHVVSGKPDGEEPFLALFERAERLVGAFGVDAARRLVNYRALIATAAPIAEVLQPAPA